MNHLHCDELEEDGHVWAYRKILSHASPFTKQDPQHQGSSYNLMVEWENGDISEEPLNWMIKENPIPVAQYAIEADMLDTPGWKQLKRLAKREKLLTRLIKQAKL